MTLRELEIKVKGTNIRRTEADLAKLETQANKAAAAIQNLQKTFSSAAAMPKLSISGRVGGGGRGGSGGGGGGGGSAGAFSSMSTGVNQVSGAIANMGRISANPINLIGKLGQAFGALGQIGTTVSKGLSSAVSGFGSLGGMLGNVIGIIGLVNGAILGVVGGGLQALGGILGTVVNVAGEVIGVLGNIAGGIISVGLEAAKAATELTAMFLQQQFAQYVSYEQQIRGLAAYEDNAKSLTETLGRLRQLAKLPGLALPEVIQATVGLRAAGMDAENAERSIMGFARALAAVGKGKADFKGAMLALQQIVTAGKLEGDEIRQLSERVPQIRMVLLKAFGSAKGEEISKMMEQTGKSVFDVVDMINTEMLKLPSVSGGVSTNLENVMDDLAEATRPVGQGLAAMFTASQPGMQSLIENISQISTAIGEVFYSIGQSGVIQEALASVFGFVDTKSLVDNFREAAARIASYIIAAVHQIPVIYTALKDGATALFTYLKEQGPTWANELIYWVKYIGLVFKEVFEGIKSFMTPFVQTFQVLMWSLKRFAEGTKSLKEGDLTGAIGNYGLGVTGIAGATVMGLVAPVAGLGQAAADAAGRDDKTKSAFAELEKQRKAGTLGKDFVGGITSAFNSVPELKNIGEAFGSVGTKADDIYGRIAKNMQAMPTLPDGLNYGNRPVQPTGAIGGGNKSLDTLKEIATNTGKTADRLSLRTQTLGGGELAKLGVTPTELRGGARVNSPGLRTAPSLIEQGLRSFMSEQSRKGDPSRPFRRS
jgi:tape measure domain-containing protein